MRFTADGTALAPLRLPRPVRTAGADWSTPRGRSWWRRLKRRQLRRRVPHFPGCPPSSGGGSRASRRSRPRRRFLRSRGCSWELMARSGFASSDFRASRRRSVGSAWDRARAGWRQRRYAESSTVSGQVSVGGRRTEALESEPPVRRSYGIPLRGPRFPGPKKGIGVR